MLLRDASGVHTYPLLVQTTPANILWGLAPLVTITSRQDFLTHNLGPCRVLLHASHFRRFENEARHGELWDLGCEFSCSQRQN